MTTVTETPVERVLAALEVAGCNPRRSGRGYVSRCPAHEDRNPSLGLDEGEDGRALVRCWTGCDFRSIVSALGLEPRQMFAGDDGGQLRAVPPRRLLSRVEVIGRDIEARRSSEDPSDRWHAWEAYLLLGGDVEHSPQELDRQYVDLGYQAAEVTAAAGEAAHRGDSDALAKALRVLRGES